MKLQLARILTMLYAGSTDSLRNGMAGKKKLAPQVCSLLAVIKGKVAHKGATSEEIVAALRRDHPDAIKAETADILHIGLIQLANQVCRLRSGGATSVPAG